MEAKLQKLKAYLKDPQKAISDDFSLLIALQEVLHIRESESSNTLYDRDIYELFYATIFLFIQPIEGTPPAFSRWDKISPAFKRMSPDEKIVRLDGFDGKIKKTYELWADFKSLLLKDRATIEYERRQENKQTILRKICDSFIMISFPYKYTIEYEKYILSIEDNIEDSVPIEKEYSGIANALREYIRGASDNDLATIINTKSLPQGASKKEWIGKKVDAHRFRERIGMKTSQWNKCFQLPQRQKLTDNMKGQSTYKEKDGKCDILNILQRFCL
ncbi:hypothetical protein [Alistipes sp.]|uniref:hypothetical protein n=1 Tax=Alistipes sp. TaxID=1872444 RepID=UPI003AB86774